MATVYGQSITVHQSTSQNIPLYLPENTVLGSITINIWKPGDSGVAWGNVTTPNPIKNLVSENLFYIWDADATDLDTLGCCVVKVTGTSNTSYTFVNVIDALPSIPEIAPRPAL